jgi:hypothetical protein
MGRRSQRSAHFIFQEVDEGWKSGSAKCKHCQKKASIHTTRQADHLKECDAYLLYSARQKRQRDEQDDDGPLKRFKISPKEHDDITEAAANMLFECGLPFTFFQQPAVRRFLTQIQPAWKPVDESTFRRQMLDNKYFKLKEEVDEILDNEQYLGLSIDDTSNITLDRISNVSVTTSKGTFYYHNLVLNGETQTADLSFKGLLETCRVITRNNLSRINAISMDTCSHNLLLQARARAYPEFQHSFFINCDAHGINLLIRDLLKLPQFDATVKLASQIFNHFAHSPKQKTLVKEYRQQLGIKSMMFRSPVDTRWGSHIDAFEALINNRPALRLLLTSPHADFESSERARTVYATLPSNKFWSDLTDLYELIRPLRSHIHVAESTSSHIGFVRKRWDVIYSELQAWQTMTGQTIFGLEELMRSRRKRQLTDLHELAHVLMPTTIRDGYTFPPGMQQRLLDLLRVYIPDDSEYDNAEGAFLDYVTQMRAFHAGDQRWHAAGSPHRFWQRYNDESRSLTLFTMRLLKTVANSAACERAFSHMKRLHSKVRNRLDPERVNKLLFIAINEPILRQSTPWESLCFDSDDDDNNDIEDYSFELVSTRVEPSGGEEEEELTYALSVQ